MRRLAVMLLGLWPVVAPAFDAASYFKDAWYGRPPLFSVVTPFAGVRWDYIYGFAANNRPYPVGGVEWYLMRDNPARDDHGFFKVRLEWAGAYGFGEVDGMWNEHFFAWPGVIVYGGYSWTWRSADIPFVERFSPFVALGAGNRHFLMFSTTDFPSAVAFSEGDYPHGAVQAGADLVVARHLMALRVVWNTAFGVFLREGPLNGRFHSTTDLAAGFVMYLR